MNRAVLPYLGSLLLLSGTASATISCEQTLLQQPKSVTEKAQVSITAPQLPSSNPALALANYSVALIQAYNLSDYVEHYSLECMASPFRLDRELQYDPQVVLDASSNDAGAEKKLNSEIWQYNQIIAEENDELDVSGVRSEIPKAKPKVPDSSQAPDFYWNSNTTSNGFLKFLENFRLKSTPDQIDASPDKNSTDFVETDIFYANGLSISQSGSGGTTKTLSTSLVGSLGFDLTTSLGYKNQMSSADADGGAHRSWDFIPYIAGDLEKTETPGEPSTRKYASDTIDYGLDIVTTRKISDLSSADTAIGFPRVTLRGDILRNYGNQVLFNLYSLNLKMQPISWWYINNPKPLLVNPSWPYIMSNIGNLGKFSFIVEARASQGWYSHQLPEALTNKNLLYPTRDYTRLGGRLGAAWLPDVMGSSAQVLADYTLLGPVAGYTKPVGIVEVMAKVPLFNGVVSAGPSWINGRREDTSQRYEKWMLQLTAGY